MLWGRLHKSCTQIIMFAARHVEKFVRLLPIAAQLLERIMPFFECLLLKMVGGPATPVGFALASLIQSLASVQFFFRVQHPLGAKIWSFIKKVDLGGSQSISRTLLLVDESSLDFLPTRKRFRRSRVFAIFEILLLSGYTCNRSLKLSKMAPSYALFGPKVFRAGPRIAGCGL